MSSEFIERNAQKQNYSMNLRNEYGKIEYYKQQKERFAPFKILDKQMIMLNCVK